MKDGTPKPAENQVDASGLGEGEGDAAWETPVLLKLRLAEAETIIVKHGIGVDGPAHYS